MMRDDFPPKVKEILAKRVGYRCSNISCWQLTSGPQEEPSGTMNVGVAAHITAASPDGPRYDASLTPEQRMGIENGIWLCQKCGKLVDNDATCYTVEKLREWKKTAEKTAKRELEAGPKKENPRGQSVNVFIRLEKMMPDLLAEMRKDLGEFPFRREFVLLKKTWSYWAGGDELMYYFEDHPELEGKVRILENHGLIQDITHGNVARYVMGEELADYLTAQ